MDGTVTVITVYDDNDLGYCVGLVQGKLTPEERKIAAVRHNAAPANMDPLDGRTIYFREIQIYPNLNALPEVVNIDDTLD